MKTKPRAEKNILTGIWKFIIVAGILAFLIEFIIYLFGLSNGTELSKLRTMVLTTAIFFELFFVYTCRSKKPLLKIGIFSNKWLNYSILASIVLQLILVYTPLGILFGVAPLSIFDWLIILPIAFSGLLIFEIAKYIKTKNGDILEDGN